MTSLAPIRFDRATGVLEGANAWEHFAALLLIGGSKVLSPFLHRGYRIGANLVRSTLRPRDVAVALAPDAVFPFPYGDSYWSKLLDRTFVYEEDTEFFLQAAKDIDYVLIDCGANYGYFSVLASSAAFGSHSSIAIEPSSENYARLVTTARANSDRFRTMRRAIGDKRGTARLTGQKHEAFSIVGGAATGGEEVEVIALDNLIDEGIVAAAGTYVIKLDVEGVEAEAIRGAARLLAGDSIAVCEEHGSDRNHTVSRYILKETPLKLLVQDPATGRFEIITDVSPLDRIKTASHMGYNVFATASPLWLDFIEQMNARAMRGAQ